MTPLDYPTAFQLWGGEERAAIDRVIASGNFTMGAEVEAFEAEFAIAHGMRNAIMVNSGSSANLIAVAALKAKGGLNGALVAVPAIAWSTTYAPLVQYGFRLHVSDCHHRSWNVPADTALADVAVFCSVLGNPCPVNTAMKWTIEDNCESIWAEDAQGRLCGTRAMLNTFSFFWSHQLSAIEGGMILTNHDALANCCRMFRAHGWTRDVAKPREFAEEYDFRLFGYNVRPLELHAAIAREQFRKVRLFRDARRRNYEYFINRAEGLLIMPQLMEGTPNPFGLAFRTESSSVRERLVVALRSNGIDCRLPTGGSFTMHEYGRPWRKQCPTPVADEIHRTALFLGNAPFDISDKIDRVIKVMRQTL